MVAGVFLIFYFIQIFHPSSWNNLHDWDFFQVGRKLAVKMSTLWPGSTKTTRLVNIVKIWRVGSWTVAGVAKNSNGKTMHVNRLSCVCNSVGHFQNFLLTYVLTTRFFHSSTLTNSNTYIPRMYKRQKSTAGFDPMNLQYQSYLDATHDYATYSRLVLVS
jgi:hypothetical protein